MDGPLPLPAAKMEVARRGLTCFFVWITIVLSSRHVYATVVIEEAVRVERQRDDWKLVSTIDAGINEVRMRDRLAGQVPLPHSHCANGRRHEDRAVISAVVPRRTLPGKYGIVVRPTIDLDRPLIQRRRSEERRVGKEWKTWGWSAHERGERE